MGDRLKTVHALASLCMHEDLFPTLRTMQLLGAHVRRRAPLDCPVPHETMLISLGFDFGQVYSCTDRSTGVLVVR